MNRFWLAWGCACGLLILSGCPDPQAPTRQRRTLAVSGAEEGDVHKAIDYLEHIDDFEERSARAQAAYGLNRWIDSQKFDTSWQPDEMVNRVPRAVRERGALDDLGRRRFDQDDMRYVQEAVWMRQLADWVSRQPLDPLFARSAERQLQRLDENIAERLTAAYRLFDWTVRNIRLDDLLPSPDEAVAAPAAGTGDAAATTAAIPAALRGIPGPGYHFDPIQILLYGHGDAWQRMRIFTLLGRQQGLDVVTLAFPGRTIPPRPRPWVSGVLLGDQLYLFDLRLGMPIAGPQGVGIATLKQVLDDPSLLQQMAIADQHPYEVADEDLREVVALIDVVSPALSWRMYLVERQFIGEHRTTLSVPLSALSERLQKSPGLSDVYVWSVPFEANWYRQVIEKLVENDSQAAAQHFAQYAMFTNRTPLVRGRIAYLRGQFESAEDKPGAKALLSQTRISDVDLARLETSEELQQQFGLQRTPNEQQWQAQVAMFRAMLSDTKQHASFWLGMCQLEAGRPDAAIEWLQTRSLEVWPDGIWSPLARYNLARANEQLGKPEEAQRLLLGDVSLQEHGSYLRARLLQRQKPETSTPAESQ